MQKVLERLRELLHEGQALGQQRRVVGLIPPVPFLPQPGSVFQQGLQTWAMDCRAALKFVQLAELAAYFEPPTFDPSDASMHTIRLAALESAISQIQSGFVGNIRRLLHADIFESMIEQADALLTAGHTTPAAVLGRIVIEQWLRDRAEAVGIPDHDKTKASKLNDDLKKAGEYSVPKWRQIQTHVDVGNSAAHGKTDEFTDDQVRQLLEYARANCL